VPPPPLTKRGGGGRASPKIGGWGRSRLLFGAWLVPHVLRDAVRHVVLQLRGQAAVHDEGLAGDE